MAGGRIQPGGIGVTARFNGTVDKALAALTAAGVPAAKLGPRTPDDTDSVRVGTRARNGLYVSWTANRAAS